MFLNFLRCQLIKPTPPLVAYFAIANIVLLAFNYFEGVFNENTERRVASFFTFEKSLTTIR